MWYKNAFRRMVVDTHIPDWDPRFLSEFDTHNFVEMLKKAQAQSIVLYAHSHVGLFLYPTQVGVMHRGLKGHDLFGELVDLCHQNNIAAVAYTSLIFDRWASDTHPDWRIKLQNGQDADANGRHGLCCPNSPYRDYTARWAEELLTRYPADGIRYDMTFWPAICYCRYCRERFEREVGGKLPETIDWENIIWVAFQRKREEWLADFAGHMTNTARRARPEVSVEHQASTFSMDWRLGVSDKLVPHNDFLQGDFYGDALQGSFVRKMLNNLSPNMPYGFETSIAMNLGNHTVIKSKELVKAKACAAVAGQGAMIFIDAIDPVGTLNPHVYDRIGSVLSDTMRYDPFRGGELAQDVAVYFSLYSKHNPSDSGKNAQAPDLAGRFPHLDAMINACSALITHHIPFGVVTKRDLHRLNRHRILVLPNVLMMDQEEVAAIKKYVAEGGNLYVSKGASLITEGGVRQPDFMLGEVFGVRYQGETKERFTYVAPETAYTRLMPEYSKKYPFGLDESQTIVSANPGSQVLAKIVLPYTDPADYKHFASIHSNPPGVETTYPSLILHTYGKGQVIYSASCLEGAEYACSIFINILKLFQVPFTFEADAPGAVEVTVFDQPDQKRLVINLLNFQKDLPNIPVNGAKVRIRLSGKTPGNLLRLPESSEFTYSYWNDVVEWEVPCLETFMMFSLGYNTKLVC
jgi:beta-galactosidase GanA